MSDCQRWDVKRGSTYSSGESLYVDRLIRRHGCYDHPGKEAAQHGEELAHDEKKSKRVNVKLKVDRELENSGLHGQSFIPRDWICCDGIHGQIDPEEILFTHQMSRMKAGGQLSSRRRLALTLGLCSNDGTVIPQSHNHQPSATPSLFFVIKKT